MSRQADLYSRWALDMRRNEQFRPGERLGVAVSGGPDSALLLEFMLRLARETGLTLAVVHFNHHLRGGESDEDERFVRELAGERGLEFLRGEANVAEVAREQRRNLEATARELRYRFFFSLVSQGKLDKVATAHTANDQAETVLLRLLRGAGTGGLGGIYPILEGKVVRPFLSVRRAEIEAEVGKRKLGTRLDSTNSDTRLRRNKIRRELLPLLEEEFNPRVVMLLKEASDRARDDEAYLEQQARERAHAWRVHEGAEDKIPVRPLLDFPPAIARRVLRQMIFSVRGSARGVTYAHLEAVLRFARQAQSGRSLALPGGVVARMEFDWLVVGPKPQARADGEFSYAVVAPGQVAVSQLGLTFRFEIVGPEALEKSYNWCEKAGLDPQKLSGELVLRNWHAGDCFRPLGSRKTWKLKELFQSQRIPVAQRKLWPVLESGTEIVWVRGFPPASPAAAVPGSKQVMVIREEASPRKPREIRA